MEIQKVTHWISGIHLPVREGIYQVLINNQIVNGECGIEGYRKILANDGNWYGEVQTIIQWTVFYEIQGNYQFMLPIPDKFCFQWRGLQEMQ